MTELSPDAPKTLVGPEKRARLDLLNEPHVAVLTDFVRALRTEVKAANLISSEDRIPYFDPLDGGVEARCLFLFEAPGPRAVGSGFVSRDNPDETAKTFFCLNRGVGPPRCLTASWNVVPWYIERSDRRIRPASWNDVLRGLVYLHRLLPAFEALETIVLSGRKAQRAASFIELSHPSIRLRRMPHPSPSNLNRRPGDREEIRRVLGEAAAGLVP